MRRIFSTILFATVAHSVPTDAAPTHEQVEFFEKSVRPVLADHCYKCHGEEKQKGDLRVDSLAALLKGSDSGPVVFRGDPMKGTFIKSIRHEIDNKMPEKAPKLSDEKIAALTEWVKMGMPWPENDKAAPSKADVARTHWAFQPIRKPAVPAVKDAAHWAQNEVDRFVLAKLETAGLAPSPIASRYALIRRATFDLTGLPPTSTAVADFQNDPAPTHDAFAKVVDRLLASPQYGERWGRHWLDVARYADHRGYLAGGVSREYPFAWTYRDWVIAALNEDMPYDQFLTRQLAADIPGSGARPGDIAALGFLTLGRRFLNNTNDIIDDRIDVIMRGTMSLTVGCARCHDHKFDPITAKDYYALYGVMASSEEDSDPEKLPLLPGGKADPEFEKARAGLLAELRASDQNIADKLSATLRIASGLSIFISGETIEPLISKNRIPRKILDERNKVKLKFVKLELEPGAPPRAHVLRDRPQPVKPHVFIRGNPARPGELVDRRFPSFLGGDAAPFKQGSGRLELAKAITAPANPLTARVITNRVWLHHFGSGFAATPGDFGVRSEKPVQIDLLNWLAANFTEQGWSLKKLHRTILLSSTWMQESVHPAQLAQATGKNPQSVDPENRLLWRQNRQRLEWEAMHDSLLAAAGNLDATIGGRPVQLFKEPYPKRRAVYAYIDRQNLPGTLRTFDFASPDLMNAQRSTTSVPQQALYMMNSPFVIAQAETLTAGPDFASTQPEERHVQMLYQHVLARNATPAEVKAAVDYVKAAETAQRTPPPTPAWRYGYGNYDAATHAVSFTPFASWSGTAWQTGPKLPDPKFGYVHINATGGHPSQSLAAIRRFTASREMTVSLSGEIVRAASVGNGIHARIVSSKQGPLAEYEVGPKATVPSAIERIELAAGETLDFIVESKGDDNSDSFTWQTVLYSADGISYDAKKQFAGPPPKIDPFTPWERYAQVLLETNEFIFVD
ncbi:MAG: PSD1 and planctomycete cytochrome C domain-containing protein [Chthoniobacteraceae bacterium]